MCNQSRRTWDLWERCWLVLLDWSLLLTVCSDLFRRSLTLFMQGQHSLIKECVNDLLFVSVFVVQ